MGTKANLVIDQGATFSTTITVTDADGVARDLTGYTGDAQIRRHYTSSNSVSFAVSISENTGEITLSLTPEQSGSLEGGTRYVYDLEVTDSSNVVSRILEGIVTVTPSVTR
jgi:hypothetical protein